MYNHSPYSVLGINEKASIDEIKKAYRDIALSCHPDKLGNILDNDEKNRRIEKFKEATVAYEKLTTNDNKFQNMKWEDENIDWTSIWQTFCGEDTKEVLKDAFLDIASIFLKNKIYPKQYYNPTSNLEEPIYHDIKLPITYTDILKNTKKKLRLILVEIDEPIFIDVYCGSFPTVVREFTDDDNIDHQINITMNICEQDGYNHLITKSGKIDLITTLEIDLKEYIVGYEKDITFVDGENIPVKVPPFQKNYHIIENKGLKGGSLIINIAYKNIDNKAWDLLCQKDKDDMIRILNVMYKTI